MKFLQCIVCRVAILSNLRSLFTKTQISNLAAMAEETDRQGTWRAYSTDSEAELFHRGHTVVYGLSSDLKIPKKVLNDLERLPLFSMKL